MSGTKAILDSNTIILASKERLDIEALFSRYDEFYASIITYAEVYAFDFQSQSEKDIVDEIFSSLNIIEITKEIADLAVVYRKNPSKRIKLPDALILASAKQADAELLTDNWKDFHNIDTSVTVQKIDDLKI